MTTPRDTVAGLLRERRRRADKALLICDDDRLTYADADAGSRVLARRLVALGAGKGTHVGLLYPNGSEFVVAMLAAARIGAVVVPFSTFSTADELRRQLVDSDVSILLAARTYRSHDYRAALHEAVGAPLGRGPLFSATVPVLRHIVFDDKLGDASAGIAGLEDDVDGSDVLSIIYTSGSTSHPKGVVHTHASLIGHQHSLNEIRALTESDRLFCNSPFFWIGGFAYGLLATLVAGATLICSNATDAGRTLDLIEAERPTITNGFVAGIAHLTRHPSFARRDLSSMRRGNLYPIMAADVRPADPELRHNMLGMTETGSVVLLSGDESDQPESRRGSYGFLAPGFEARVVDDELLLRGPFLMQGYYGRSREEAFDTDGWFHTGDLVRRDDDGVFYFVGRAGAMIKTAGANVTPAEVEKALATVLEPIDSGAVVHVLGLPDDERGQIVAAAIATDTLTALDQQQVREALRAQLSAYKIPRRMITLRHDDVPRLSSGKVDLPALTRLFDA
ncbi:class I adenylate-forming enzyme family protein [Mycolicibacterium sp. BiH015]|uniref:class I adenylate-forming enzyme family protein n=1 Tax=Mycolicibacterium sp. BiH015 TaxID=3018808 RepID=UPI0022E5E58F|nr:class I adenylate-forming enzyme family protein [Mycolicibacterium sp. BiH015]MDA2895316.1 class I adenylate-forming enzyme family protein [Mycolicibacterium sp. BiH015]